MVLPRARVTTVSRQNLVNCEIVTGCTGTNTGSPEGLRVVFSGIVIEGDAMVAPALPAAAIARSEMRENKDRDEDSVDDGEHGS